MKRQWRATVVVALLFGGMMALALLISSGRRGSAPTLSAVPAPIELFPAVQPDAITRIVVTDQASGRRVTLTRVPGDWQAVLADGSPAGVDLPNVTRMIQILATLRYNRVLEESNVANYGLAGAGKASIEFDAGTTHRLRVGNAAAYTDYTYVQRDADPAIYVVSSSALRYLTAALPTPTPALAATQTPNLAAPATAQRTPPSTLASPPTP